MLFVETGMLWQQPSFHETALVLAASWPSGSPEFVRLREAIPEAQVGPGWSDWTGWTAPSVRHLTASDEFIPIGEVFVGGSRPGFELTPWCNPVLEEGNRLFPSFIEYLGSRCDTQSFSTC